MRDDLTYRQQRNLNLISEALLTGRTDLLEQVDREASMLDEQFGGSARPKLTIDTPIGSGPIDVSGAGDVDDTPDADAPAGEAGLLRNIQDTLDDLLGIEGGRKEGGSIIDNNILRRRLRAARRRHMKAWREANPGSTKQEREDERRKFTRDFVIKDVIGGVALYYGLRSPSRGGGGGGPSKPGGGGGGSAP